MPTLQRVQPVLMSRDVEASIRFYATLGFEPAFRDVPDDPKYAGIRRDGIEIHLQWHDAEQWAFPIDRPAYRFVVDDVDGLSAEFRQRGVSADVTAVADTPWGTREFHVRDPGGNVLQFYRRR